MDRRGGAHRVGDVEARRDCARAASRGEPQCRLASIADHEQTQGLRLALVYGAVAFTAIHFAVGGSRRSSRQTAGLSAKLMQSGGGKALLVLVGLVMAAILIVAATGFAAYGLYSFALTCYSRM